MSKQLTQLLRRLQKPSVLLSLISQVVSVLILLGFNLNENRIMAVMTLICSIMVTLGIMHNPDTLKKGYGDDLLLCAADGSRQHHVLVNGQMVCSDCGAVYDPADSVPDTVRANLGDDSLAQEVETALEEAAAD